jgi:MoaA/NifB/PqqE/SkfB family radical SAM enzyme
MNKTGRSINPGVASKIPYYELLVNLLFNFVSVHLRLKLFRPLMTNVYITKRCNLRCVYCYPPGDEGDMDRALGLELLEKIRPKNPAINFTGGEPLLHPHLADFVKRSQELRFFPIVLSTNAYDIKPLFEILPMLDNLIISLDAVNTSVNDLLCGTPGATCQILENIRILAELRMRFRFNITLHAVICEGNINGLDDLVSFCDSLNLTLSVSPEHSGQYPCRNLLNNQSYAAGIRKLRRLKRSGKAITCSSGYLDRIEKFAEHRCFPFLSPRIEPNGTLYFPCYRIRSHACNLKDYDTLYALMREKGQWMDMREECRKRCFLACYMEVEQYVINPLRLIREIPFRKLTLGKKIG